MFETTPTLAAFLADRWPQLAQIVLLAALSGWAGQRIAGFSLRIRGIQLALGLAGVYFGTWLWQSVGWHPGPMFADVSLLASIGGAILIFGCLRVLELAISAAAYAA
jgi:uncharacterized membrane protein YeaQ/YmgE (transglycosylase-associated protein family)